MLHHDAPSVVTLKLLAAQAVFSMHHESLTDFEALVC
jgi:hypothetical protein